MWPFKKKQTLPADIQAMLQQSQTQLDDDKAEARRAIEELRATLLHSTLQRREQ